MGNRSGSRKLNMVYPEEREARTKDANKKLKSENNSLRKQIKKLKEENSTLKRSFNKSCDFIQSEHGDKSIEKVISIVNNFDYKETEKGRQKEVKTEKDSNKNFILQNCPKCGKTKEEGFKIMHFEKFKVLNCECGHRTRIDGGGIKRN